MFDDILVDPNQIFCCNFVREYFEDSRAGNYYENKCSLYEGNKRYDKFKATCVDGGGTDANRQTCSEAFDAAP